MYPCSVDEMSWTKDTSIKSLFGHLCSGTIFAHDNEMLATRNQCDRSQTCERENSESLGSTNLNIFSDKSAYSNENDHGVIPSNRLKRSKPALPVDMQNTQRSSAMAGKLCNETKSTIATLLPNARQYAQRLRAIKDSFDAWLDQPESMKTLIRPTNFKGTQESQSTASGSTPHSHFTPEPTDSDPGFKLLSTAVRDKVQFECGWVECKDSFDVRSRLRPHVKVCHLAKTIIGDHETYSCLWRGCNSSNDLFFQNQSSWEDHLDREHGLGASINHVEISDGLAPHSNLDCEKYDYDRTKLASEVREAWTDDNEVDETQSSLNNSVF